MAKMVEEWVKEFQPKLGNTRRWEGFNFIIQELAECGFPPNIVETGCLRTTDDWAGNGQSTFIWDFLAKHFNAEVTSIDISLENVRHARIHCPNINVDCYDSLEWMIDIGHAELGTCDLLFLDSYDHDPPYAVSELHAIGELACAWAHLPMGCLIAVDDCNGDGTGKHALIRHFFDRLGVKPLLDGYIHVWRKP